MTSFSKNTLTPTNSQGSFSQLLLCFFLEFYKTYLAYLDFQCLKMKELHYQDLFFSVRSKTLDIKEWNPWSYSDNICIACRKDDLFQLYE